MLHELDVAAFLAGFYESGRFKTALDLRKGWGLSRPNRDLNHADLRRPCCLQRLEVQFNRFLEVGKSRFLSLALAGDVEFQALGHIPVTFAPKGSGKRSRHVLIVSQARLLGATAPAPEGSEPKLGRSEVLLRSAIQLAATRTKIRGVAGFLERDSG